MSDITVYLTSYLTIWFALFNGSLCWMDTKWNLIPQTYYKKKKLILFLFTGGCAFTVYISLVLIFNHVFSNDAAKVPIKIGIITIIVATLAILCFITVVILYFSVESHNHIRALGNHYHLTLKLFSDVKHTQSEYPIFVSERHAPFANIEVHADELHCLTHLFGQIAASNVVHQKNIQILHPSTIGAPDHDKSVSYAIIGSPVNNPRAKLVNNSLQLHKSSWKLEYSFRTIASSDGNEICVLDHFDRAKESLIPREHAIEKGRWTDYAIIAKIPNCLSPEPGFSILFLAGCKAGGSYALAKYVSDLSLLDGIQIDSENEKIDISKYFYCVFEVDYYDKRPAMPDIHTVKPIAGRNLEVH